MSAPLPVAACVPPTPTAISVATLLSTAYAEGRLTREEHDERTDQLMSAKTFDDLVSDYARSRRGRHT